METGQLQLGNETDAPRGGRRRGENERRGRKSGGKEGCDRMTKTTLKNSLDECAPCRNKKVIKLR